MISVIRRWGGERWPAGRWRCDANDPTGGPSRVVVACCRTHGFPRGGGSLAPVIGREDERVNHPGQRGANLPNTARGAPGIRQFRGDYTCVLLAFRTQGCGAVVAPAFRAPSFEEGAGGLVRRSPKGEDGNEVLEDGLPGAAKNTGDESRLLLFTLPWRGRVDRLSVSENDRGGVTFTTIVSPHPARCRSRPSPSRGG